MISHETAATRCTAGAITSSDTAARGNTRKVPAARTRNGRGFRDRWAGHNCDYSWTEALLCKYFFMGRAYLGEFEHLVLLTVLRLGAEAWRSIACRSGSMPSHPPALTYFGIRAAHYSGCGAVWKTCSGRLTGRLLDKRGS